MRRDVIDTTIQQIESFKDLRFKSIESKAEEIADNVEGEMCPTLHPAAPNRFSNEEYAEVRGFIIGYLKAKLWKSQQ